MCYANCIIIHECIKCNAHNTYITMQYKNKIKDSQTNFKVRRQSTQLFELYNPSYNYHGNDILITSETFFNLPKLTL